MQPYSPTDSQLLLCDLCVMLSSREKRKKPKTCVFLFPLPLILLKKPPSPGGCYKETLLEMTGLGAAGPAGDTCDITCPESRVGSTPASGCPWGPHPADDQALTRPRRPDMPPGRDSN